MSSKIAMALVFGGKSPEHEISILSARNIYQAINKDKYNVTLIGINQYGKWFLETEENLLDKNCVIGKNNIALSIVFGDDNQQLIRLDNATALPLIEVAFPITHGPNGEDGSIQGVFRHMNLAFVGPDVMSSAVTMDKDFTKRILQQAGIQVSDGEVIYKYEQDKINYTTISQKYGNIVYIKPCNMGSSIGVSKATDEASFNYAIQEGFKFDNKLLVEKAIVGREIECAVLGNEHVEASTVGEIVMQQGFYDFESKYQSEDAARLDIPAKDLTTAQIEKIRQTAIAAYKALDIEGLSRVDVFLTDDDKVIVNEPNTLPGFTNISMYPKLWEACGLSYADLIDKLILLAIQRHKRYIALQKVRIAD
ncbi:MAG: D-alanine--D-alanine ligase [Chitinophagales bacterium]|nr:D-alanine--D-alanine ligase [Chitinophagales bacterium]